MQDDEQNASLTQPTPARKTLRLSLAAINLMLRKAKWETRKAQARENWIRSMLTDRLREDRKDSPRGDE